MLQLVVQCSNQGVPICSSWYQALELYATFLLAHSCSYEVRSPHRIALSFEEARVGNIKISPTLEALLAPALLPRGWLQQQLLLAIQTVSTPRLPRLSSHTITD